MSLLRALVLLLVVAPGIAGLLSGCDEPPQPTINLYRAVHTGDLDQIKRHLFWKTDVNQPGPDGDYPLHVSASQGRVVITRELLAHGARIDVRDALGRTPLHAALANGKIQSAELLFQQGAEDDPQTLLFDLASTQQLDRDSIALLSARGADLDASNPDGQTPLHLAVGAANLGLAKQLISAGASVNPTDAEGRTPLQIAQAQGQTILVRLLQQYGAER
jgi:ankyrin repeat protein